MNKKKRKVRIPVKDPFAKSGKSYVTIDVPEAPVYTESQLIWEQKNRKEKHR